MPWLALNFDLGDLAREVAEAACIDAGACAVTFSDAGDDAVLEPAPGEVRLWPATRVQALFESARVSVQLPAALATALGIDAAQLQAQSIEDRVWEREWLRDFHAMRFGQQLWVCPQHERVEAADAVVVRLDPGLAFGTGTHPSTGLCLTWLDAASRPGPAATSAASYTASADAAAATLRGQCVIDYGCGSGILAIAALKLGAARVHAYDIDPQALTATRDNAASNAVLDRLSLCTDPAQLPAQCGLLLANILAGPLCELAGRFAALLAPGGRLLLAGLLASQAAEVTAAYAPWFDMAPAGEREGWITLAGIRHPCSPSAPSAR